MTALVSLSVTRGTEEAGTRVQQFQVPFAEGMSVLDALIWIRAHEDPTLAVRYSCINANACKECSLMVDGEVTYACTARLTPAGAKVEPLEGKTLIRDLVTDILPAKEHLAAALKPRR
ncbi:2Fe-2S iron-sulfur cluster-binding protein [Bradyrhizobium sp. NP1]|uniref:2Fe-2S iron-sulfur cluster-binding protein n=1 Tax=Bradyrhizobium sp. NP1 TaxID=3049772 RepID=UPI0025A61623|nr:2Fe-2S iron-sulfur cluster-binding protein [Bradyrhizobium sp. NP1]WJR77920.1 2Fe-2S iron-sulfur cluster-binding protein [Bradyrhizobium sp. NP1]